MRVDLVPVRRRYVDGMYDGIRVSRLAERPGPVDDAFSAPLAAAPEVLERVSEHSRSCPEHGHLALPALDDALTEDEELSRRDPGGLR